MKVIFKTSLFIAMWYFSECGLVFAQTNQFKQVQTLKDLKSFAGTDPDAQIVINLLHKKNPEELEITDNEANEWLKKSAESGNSLGQFLYAESLKDANKADAFKWYLKSAEQGNALAQLKVGHIYKDGINELGKDGDLVRVVVQNNAESFKWFLKAAEAGNAEAQKELGWQYYLGKGVNEDKEEAKRRFLSAASQDGLFGQTDLGLIYKEEKNYQEAVKWYQMAADRGDSQAKYELGMLYFESGPVQNYEKAAKLFKSIALDDNFNSLRPCAAIMLGNMYFKGLGVTMNFKDALTAYHIAAINDAYPDTTEIFSDLLPDDVKRSGWAFESAIWHERVTGWDSAKRYYLRAAFAGNPLAQFKLGRVFSEGKFIHHDKIEAYKWYQQAIRNGMEAASAPLTNLESQLTPRDTIEALNRANGFYNITNSRGQVFKNIFVLQIDPNGIVYAGTTGEAAGKFKFEAMSKASSELFFYDPESAAEYEKNNTEPSYAKTGPDRSDRSGTDSPGNASNGDGVGTVLSAATALVPVGIEVTKASTKVIDSSGILARWSWIIGLRNKGSSVVSVDMTIEYLDKDGFNLDQDSDHTDLNAGETRVVTGFLYIDKKVGAKVTSIKITIRKR